MINFNFETLKSGKNPPLQTSLINFDVAIATFNSLLNMAVLEERLNKSDIEIFWAMYQCILNGPLYMVLQYSKLFDSKV